MLYKFLLTPLFLTKYHYSFAREYQSYAGAIFDENPETGVARANNDALRHSGKVRTMLHTLVCGNDANCPYEAKHFFLALRYYGCNCYSKMTVSLWNANSNWWHMEHHGAPIDAVDEACMNLVNAYKCMFRDEQNGNITQNAHYMAATGESLTCYDGQLFTYHTDAGGNIICGTSNNPDYANNRNQGCRQAACTIERAFAYEVSAFLQDPIQFRDSAHQAGTYNLNPGSSSLDESRADVCQAIKGANVRDSCCGEYPVRFPHASSRTVCCDGLISPMGTC